MANSNVRPTGGRYEIKMGVKFEDEDDPEYNHVIMWGFEPTLAVDSQSPRLDLNYVIHKKYWEELEVEPVKFTEDDGAEIVNSYGYFDSPYDPDCVTDSIKEKFKNLFGRELTNGTFNNPPESTESVDLPSVPEPHSTEVFEMTIQVDGSYTEELEESDPRYGDEKFVSEIKDEDGNVTHRTYRVSHDMAWWFELSDGQLQTKSCFHKAWGQNGMKRNFEENYPGETIVEAYREDDETPHMDSLPDKILADLTNSFGENLVRASLMEETLPRVVYECFECGDASKVTPRDNCPKCGSDSLCEFESLHHYRKHLRDRDEEEEKLIDLLASAEITVGSDQL